MQLCSYCGRREGTEKCYDCGRLVCYRCIKVCDNCNKKFCLKHFREHECES